MVRLNLRGKIFMYFCLLILLQILSFWVLNYIELEHHMREMAYRDLEARATENRECLERFMSRGYNDIELIVNNPVIKSDESSIENKLDILRMIQNTYKVYDDITLIDAKGGVITSTTHTYTGYWSKNRWYLEAMKGNFVVSQPHVLLNPSYKVVILFMGPVRNDRNEITGVVSARILLNRVWDITDKIRIGETGFLFILDEYSRLVAYPDKELILEELPAGIDLNSLNKSAGITTYRQNDVETIAGYSTLSLKEFGNRTINWKVIATQPMSEALSVVDTVLSYFILISVISLVFISLAGFLLSKSITKPLSNLTNGVAEMGKGNLDYRIYINSKDEIEELANTFNQMAKDLKKSKAKLDEYNRELGGRVKERTEELQARVDELERFHRLTVGRELKMIELKNKIEELEEKLKTK